MCMLSPHKNRVHMSCTHDGLRLVIMGSISALYTDLRTMLLMLLMRPQIASCMEP